MSEDINTASTSDLIPLEVKIEVIRESITLADMTPPNSTSLGVDNSSA